MLSNILLLLKCVEQLILGAECIARSHIMFRSASRLWTSLFSNDALQESVESLAWLE